MLMKGAYPQWSFFTGGAALFVGTIVLEGISMSLTSKVRLQPLLMHLSVSSESAGGMTARHVVHLCATRRPVGPS